MLLLKAPTAVISDSEDLISRISAPIIKVKCARYALAYAYFRFYKIDLSKFKLIGITGTAGKSTVSTMLKAILEKQGERVGYLGTGKIMIGDIALSGKDYSMTTPDPSILYKSLRKMQDEGCRYVICEVSSHALHFNKLSPLRFSLSAFTNLSSEHLDIHRDMERYYRTKLKLFEKSEIAIFNLDDKYSKRAYFEVNTDIKYTVSMNTSADAKAIGYESHGLRGSTYFYKEKDFIIKVCLPMPADYNVANSLIAIKAAVALGFKPAVAKEALKAFQGLEGRYEVISVSPTVIIDYAHTPEEMEKFIKSVYSTLISGQTLTVLFGCGGERDKEKRPKMAAIAEKYSSNVIVTEDNSRGEDTSEIIEDILSGFQKTESRKVITSREAAIKRSILEAKRDDVILLIGKGHERYSIDASGIRDFDERMIVKAALQERSISYEDKR